nr:hypothetical protein [Dyella sp. ASV24]
MPLSIQSPSAIQLATQTTSLSAAVQSQATSTSTSASSSILSMEVAPPAVDSPTYQAGLKAITKSMGLQDNLQDVASALAQSMQQIIQNRPDLAMASFDFQSDNGAIKVVSSSLNAKDKAWLEQTLNSNQPLVKAVQTFHDNAADSYALWSEADGQPLSAADAKKASDLADTSYNFMSLFRKASQVMVSTMDRNGTYTTSNGAPIDFHQNVNSALSFLVFQKSNESIMNGTNSYTTSTGRTYYGTMRGNLFSMTDAVRGLVPSFSSNSIGLKATA